MKVGKRLKGFLGAVAPGLGNAVGGPLGGLVGKMVSDALGVNTDTQALEILESDPDALLKLREAEMLFEQRLRELDVDEEKLHQLDRDSARVLARGTSILPQIVLSALFLSGYFVIVGLFFMRPEPPQSDTFNVLIGVLTGAIAAIVHFWFGSSKGSKDKTDQLGRAVGG